MSSLGRRLPRARPPLARGSPWNKRNPRVLSFSPREPLPSGDQPGDMVVTELSEMKVVRALIRQLVPTGLCPPPPIVSRPQSSALFALFGTTRSLDELTPSFSTEKAGHLMDTALLDAEHQGEGHQRSRRYRCRARGPGFNQGSASRQRSPRLRAIVPITIGRRPRGLTRLCRSRSSLRIISCRSWSLPKPSTLRLSRMPS
jgi:hypothetical protein